MDVGMKWRVALAAIVKDEEDYIVDWICYHTSIGVDHFFVYDNGSTDRTRDLLIKFVNGGLVTLISWPMRGGQVDAYSHAIKLLSGNTEWLGFLDVDEFLVMHQHQEVYELLSSLDADQLLLPWRNFPYSGHNSAPGGATLENFCWAYRIAPGAVTQVKHFVRPEMVTQVTAHFSFIKGDRTKLPTGEAHPLSHAIVSPTYAGAQINHYATRSFYENQARLRKGQVSGSSHKRLDEFAPMSAGLADRMDYDDSILRHLPKFKEERANWQKAAEYPHRFGLKQKWPVLESYNNLIFYLAKSFGNYLTDQQTIKPLSEIPFVQTLVSGSKVDLAPMLIGSKRSSIYFDVSNQGYLRFFQGTIHYGDFVRRFGFDCFSSFRSIAVADSWTQSSTLSGSGFLGLADIESEGLVTVITTLSSGEHVLAKEAIPAGRHCVIVYSPNCPPNATSINFKVVGGSLIKEAFFGHLP
jgi:hypothetical protein